MQLPPTVKIEHHMADYDRELHTSIAAFNGYLRHGVFSSVRYNPCGKWSPHHVRLARLHEQQLARWFWRYLGAE